jgi:DNA polymerase III epsilon subunit-like protein
MRFLTMEFARCGKPFGNEAFCTMKHFTPICNIPGSRGPKWPKLEELMEFLGVKPEEAIELARDVYGSEDITFHDARFDTAGLFLCFKRGILGKYIEI